MRDKPQIDPVQIWRARLRSDGFGEGDEGAYLDAILAGDGLGLLVADLELTTAELTACHRSNRSQAQIAFIAAIGMFVVGVTIVAIGLIVQSGTASAMAPVWVGAALVCHAFAGVPLLAWRHASKLARESMMLLDEHRAKLLITIRAAQSAPG